MEAANDYKKVNICPWEAGLLVNVSELFVQGGKTLNIIASLLFLTAAYFCGMAGYVAMKIIKERNHERAK
jgi:hypothetical protein